MMWPWHILAFAIGFGLGWLAGALSEMTDLDDDGAEPTHHDN